MALSNDTKSGNLGKVETISIGTPLSTEERESLGQFSKNVDTTRTSPNTAVDMDELERWKPGDEEPKGSFAKAHPGFKRYRNDMNSAPDESTYKHRSIYIDTTKPIGPQLIKLKK